MAIDTTTDDIPDDMVRSGENMSGRELLETARRVVRQLRHARGLPAWTATAADDTVGDVVEACLTAQDRGVVVTARYVYGVAHNLVHRDRTMNSADARALRMLSQATAALEQQQGHAATPAQVDALAAKILEEWDRPSRRPSRGFHRRSTVVSLDATPGFAATLAATEREYDGEEVSFDELELLADAAAAAHDKAEHSAVRRACWNTLAAVHGAPQVTGPVGKNRVTAARTVMLRHPEGENVAMGIALDHASHGWSSEYTVALFTPFSGADAGGRAQVVELLRRYRPHAVELWSAALSASSTAFYPAL